MIARTPIRPSTPTQRAVVYTLVITGALVAVFPFAWSLLASFKPPGEILTLHPRFLPRHPTLDNYREVLQSGSFARWYLNSFIVAGVVTASVCLFSSLAGYSLAKFRYAGRKILFLAILSTMMIPLEMLVIPWFLGAGELGLVDSYAGIAFPGLVSAFGVFLMKQFMDSVPDALIESARIDGASEPAVFFKVVLPLVRPALAALAIFTFVGNWDSFLWPLIVTENSQMFTLPVGLQSFAGGRGIQYHLVLTAANLVVVPSLVVFAVLQRQIIEGVTLTGLKG